MEAKWAWRKEAQATLAERTDAEFMEVIRNQASRKLAEMEEEIDKLNESLRQAVPDDVELPPVEIPVAETDPSLHGSPLVSSKWDWSDQTRALIERKSYGVEAA